METLRHIKGTCGNISEINILQKVFAQCSQKKPIRKKVMLYFQREHWISDICLYCFHGEHVAGPFCNISHIFPAMFLQCFQCFFLCLCKNNADTCKIPGEMPLVVVVDRLWFSFPPRAFTSFVTTFHIKTPLIFVWFFTLFYCT